MTDPAESLSPTSPSLPVKRPQIAALVTEYRQYSHGQNIVDCFLEGYGWESRRHRPKMDVVSVYARTMLLMEGLVHDITVAA